MEQQLGEGASPDWQEPPAYDDSPLRQIAELDPPDPWHESLEHVQASEGGSDQVLDFEAAAAVPETELQRFLQTSRMDAGLLKSLRKAGSRH